MDIFVSRWIGFDDARGFAPPGGMDVSIRNADPMAHAASVAIQELCRGSSPERRGDMGLFLGHALGSLEQDRRFDETRMEANGRYASPAVFTRTLPSTIASELTIQLGLTGPTLVVSAGAASTLLAIARAWFWMRHLGMHSCIAGGMEWLGPGIADETGCQSGDRCRGFLCMLSTISSPGATKIIEANLSGSLRRGQSYLDTSIVHVTDAFEHGAAGQITADSGEGLIVSLTVGGR